MISGEASGAGEEMRGDAGGTTLSLAAEKPDPAAPGLVTHWLPLGRLWLVRGEEGVCGGRRTEGRAPHHISLDPRRGAPLNLFIFLQAGLHFGLSVSAARNTPI